MIIPKDNFQLFRRPDCAHYSQMVSQITAAENRKPFDFRKVYKYSRHKVKDSFYPVI